ncbi:MAG: hypothetical protein V4525_16510 [Pseudomonadota bacterium]
MFEREDWTLFRNLGTLGQKAGVPLRKLAALVIKELCDNALDAGANVRVEQGEGGWFFIEDDGAGLPADRAMIERLFSVRRPLTSSKLVRIPSRGALGNGLRVVVGAVLASGGALYVETQGMRYQLVPQDDGSTKAVEEACPERVRGTLIGIRLGSTVPVTEDVLRWSQLAIAFAQLGKNYSGKTSPWWYDSESFFEMCHAAGQRPLADLLRVFREVTMETGRALGLERLASQISRQEAGELLMVLRSHSTEPQPSILGKIGEADADFCHAHEYGNTKTKETAPTDAHLPFSIDAFVRPLADGETDHITFLVNRTPITGEINVQRQKSHQLGIIGCGLRHIVDVGRKPVEVICNISTPYMPITTDGKEPDLFRYIHPLFRVIEKAAKKAKKTVAEVGGRKVSQRDVIAYNLKPSIAKASGEGQYRYSLRQLFYAVRPYMLEIFGKEPDYNYFAQVITDIESEEGRDLPGLYRDARGIIYHPHTGQEIPLGTLNVERYERPEWTFNKILYSEKEGFFTILKDAGWPERNDCALLTSKGFASRAARDVLDLIGGTQEEIYFFCIHDADASGTLIYQSLTEATRARGARKVHVINLGLDPWEAIDMDLQVETFRAEEIVKAGGRRLPVADYVNDKWEAWLQNKRVELNAMSSPQFIAWLDNKFSQYSEKVVPPKAILRDQFDRHTRQAVERIMMKRILDELRFNEQVDKVMHHASEVTEQLDLERVVRTGLADVPENRWNKPLDVKAEQIAAQIVK